MHVGGRGGVVVGVDVGGSKVLAVEVAASGEVVRRTVRSTPGADVSPDAVEDVVDAAVREAADGRELSAVGLAAAGFVDAAGERVVFAPHLPWRDAPVRERLGERWGVPVALENDAHCAAYAELGFGAARGASSALVITLGTGIGGAVVVAGQVHRGSQGMAGEFGHMQVVPDGHPCECGRRGCWEQYCSGNALVARAQAAIGHQPTLLDELCDGNPADLTGPMVTKAAEDGDLVARDAFASIADWLGVGVANLVAALDPEVAVVGGGLSAVGDRLLTPARAAFARSLVGAGHRALPPLVRAHLGAEAGAVGAAVLARRLLGAG